MPAPSHFYRQHHRVAAPRIDERHFRPAWKITGRLDELLDRGEINAAEYHAALDFREMTELALGSGVARSLSGGARAARYDASPTIDRIDQRLDARAWLDAVTVQLGGVAVSLLTGFIAADLSWAMLARRFAIDPKTAKAWTLAALRCLAACQT